MVPLTPIAAAVTQKFGSEMEFLGPHLADDVAQAIAEGDMDPISLTRFPASAETAAAPRTTSSSSIAPSAMDSRRLTSTPLKKLASPKTAPDARKLPSWVARKASPQKSLFAQPHPPSHYLRRSSPSSTKASNAKPSPPTSSTPRTISHFFAARPKSDSTPEVTQQDEFVPATPDNQSFESQDSVAIDVARSISFSPVDDEAKQTHVVGDKENAVPNADAALADDPNRGVNAFARMMKAGSVLQRHSLKRKASGRSVSVFGAAARQTGPDAIRHIKRLAFTGAATTPRPVPSASPVDLNSDEEEVEEPEAEEDDVEDPEIEDGDGGLNNQQQQQQDGRTMTLHSSASLKGRLVVAPVENTATKAAVNFARFRYSQVK
ncbi:hypothetical protein PINS_up007313 [Pythium insidiosum]|nr:hypothetical protein PINS_up007313 [Pythium insidiosum]